MSVRIQYMGTKRRLAPAVGGLAAQLRPRAPFVDLFCGMCSVAGAVAESRRQVWLNDVQHYAQEVAHCLACSAEEPPPADTVFAAISPAADENRGALTARFAAQLAVEHTVLAAPTVASYHLAYEAWSHAANDQAVAAEVAAAATAPRQPPYRMATLCFAWGYLGLEQAIAYDSIRCGIDSAHLAGTLNEDSARWCRLALLQAAARLATGPGHLAQYLHATSEKSLARVMSQRKRPLPAQFEIELGLLEPYGEASWRASNKVLGLDALQAFESLDEMGTRGGVIYADPPYSKNQYSRFYHVLETLSRYDYPAISSRGRYRSDRFITGFSRRRDVLASFEALCSGVAELDCALLLSYPADGLLQQAAGVGPEEILARHFSKCEPLMTSPLKHSTMGANHGLAFSEAQEMVWLAE